MAFERKDIAAALLKKGFALDNAGARDHDRYEYVHGTVQPIYTVLSRGTAYKTYSDKLCAKVKRQLLLDSKKQLTEFVECPMTRELYRAHLEAKEVLVAPAKEA